jgi:DNA repair protein RadD
MIGRGRRTATGKKDLILLDHTGSFPKVGMPDDRNEWSLDPEGKGHRNRDQERRSTPSGPKICECIKCKVLGEAGKPCWNCGYMPAPKPKIVIPQEGELVEIRKGIKPTKPEVNEQQKLQFLNEVAWLAQEKGCRPGYAFKKYEEKYGHKAPWGTQAQPCPTSPEVRAWCRSRDIAWAKSQGPRPPFSPPRQPARPGPRP